MRLLATLLFAPLAFAQISPRPPDAILPVVGSTRGQSSANFKTELQLTNMDTTATGGFLVLRPHGLVLRYNIPARGTISYADVVAEMGGSGLGSLDVLSDTGNVPVIVARAYDDQPAGTTGVTVPAVRKGEETVREDLGALIVPRDLTRYRFNVGVRALANGATLTLRIRSANGTERATRVLQYAANAFDQQPGDAFTTTTLQPDDSILVEISAGSAIVYATTVDNATNDSSLQLVRR